VTRVRDAGFAYLHEDPYKSIYLPVMPKTMGDSANALYAKSDPASLKFTGADTYQPTPYTFL